jgi:predicted AAA+ superfamily ATPase
VYIPRRLRLKDILDHKSCFLFGPRQTGKSSLIRHTLPDVRSYNLLDSTDFLSLSQNPKQLEQELQPNDRLIVIDEIQKLPALLDEVHLLIEKYDIHFLLTGSSARKLRQGGVNLLGGRARSRTLHPFSAFELQDHFDLLRALRYGLIPSIYFSNSPREDLQSYVNEYLTQEIASEALVRNIPAFSRFLQIAAISNSQIINYSKISNDAQVPKTTVQEYFQILKDTLIAFDVPAYRQTLKRKPITTSKFYFFDIGVARHLQGRDALGLKTVEIGEAFETYIAHELRSWCDYSPPATLQYWRSTSGFEVDFLVNENIAIEVKAKDTADVSDCRGLRALAEEIPLKARILVYLGQRPRIIDGIHVLPVADFLKRLWKTGFN